MPTDDRATVLIVEDERATAEAYERILADEYEVHVATSGDAALDVLDDSIDVILLDRRMPGFSGAQVLGEVADRDVDARVAMVTAVEPDFDIIEFDIDAYLRKPVDVDSLEDTVAALADLDTYEDLQRELGSARVKRSVIAVEKDDDRLVDHPEFARLDDRIADLEARIAAIERAHPTYFGEDSSA
ncbi:response regulator [Halococcoides cellulosivorans]|uniref:response regulator n=1 Tax=Halococcoides cellulosivorans TaxID=1679096 RepID=UPI001F18A3FF|nr:response regulator [Halococcoides cellulosivorans]